MERSALKYTATIVAIIAVMTKVITQLVIYEGVFFNRAFGLYLHAYIIVQIINVAKPTLKPTIGYAEDTLR